jgi:2-iminobutanoate/2-iminopropanoate deaminase
MQKSIYFILLISIACSCNCPRQAADAGKAVFTADAPKPIGPYSQAIPADDFLFISGQIGIDPATGNIESDDISLQAARVMDNLQAILKAAGMDFSNVVKTTIYITDMNNFAKVNEIYGKYFKENPPARETVQVARLPKNAAIEISMTAFKK